MNKIPKYADTQLMVIIGSSTALASLAFGIINVIFEIDMARHQAVGMLFLFGVMIAGFGAIIDKMQPKVKYMTKVALWLSYGMLAVAISWVTLAAQ